ncbi:ABC transporter permease [Ulvibacter litoralis]|uniref:Lipoprotein-releasing system permease protein n=1 Tax=Ulvibacter litoralis TaxID=227084 RepID=A0A1G7H174_9FLAO|nr:FtsX-like permease family protein [Ulvibacter litoralis]GHC59257.1 membrane protein [Ulvibacter litoralis]SDE94176.1 lipoprotein-releasing system permease protein [Ulvibacter litoralis]
MKIKHLTEIAIALMLARWKQTLVAAIGVTFSIALFVTLLGFMEGLNQLLDGIVLNRTPHIRLYNDIKPSKIQPIDLSKEFKDYHHFISSVKPVNTRKEIYNAQQIINKLETDDRVAGVASKISAQVFYNLGNIDLNGIINGIEVDQEAKLFAFGDYIIEGNYQELDIVSNSIILGQGVADVINAELGDIITVTSTEGEQFSLKVIGFYESGISEIDKVQSFASLETTRKLLGVSSNYISDIQIKLKDLNMAPKLAAEYESLFRLDAEDIQTANAQFETGSGVRSIISYAVGITLLIVSGFGIYNILNMLIYEKMDTIAILKATGFAGSDVKKIFISISLSIGVAGAVGGVIIGFLMSLGIDAIPFSAPSLPAVETYPIDYGLQYYAVAIIFAMLTTFLAGWMPARKASKVDPVEIIRGK